MTQVIGITGGVASGKSTITAYLREQGYPVIDADAVVHELQAKGGNLYQLLLTEFGQEILDEDGNLHRAKLSQRVFSDVTLRQRLSTLQDAVIREELQARRDDLLDQYDLIFMDIPLLFELQYENEVDQIWLVYVDAEQQVERLMARNGYSREEAQQRIVAQWPLAEKVKKAQVVLDNTGTPQETLKQVDEVLSRVLKND